MTTFADSAFAPVPSYLKSALRFVLPDPTYHLARHLGFCARSPRMLLRSMGSRGTARFVCLPVWHELRRLLAGGRGSESAYVLTAKEAQFPLRCRAGSSDIEVFRQIFVEREYTCVDDLREPLLMIDCGANVGFASAWFLSRYPRLRAIAVEPDPANAAALRGNLASFGARATVYESGVWSSTSGLTLVRGAFRDGREWAIQVRESRPEERPDLTALDIRTLIDLAGDGCVDVLKVDIEGAEGEVFGRGPTDWLERVDNLVIEIHAPELETIVNAALPEREFERSTSGELSCYRRKATNRRGELCAEVTVQT